eukprot:scaffold2954_cov171-Amphora_coffeaeformis.AAC.5
MDEVGGKSFNHNVPPSFSSLFSCDPRGFRIEGMTFLLVRTNCEVKCTVVNFIRVKIDRERADDDLTFRT